MIAMNERERELLAEIERWGTRVVVMNLRGSACAYLMAGDYTRARRDLEHAERIEKGRRDG